MSNGVDFKDLQRRMDGAIAAFHHDLASLRTGRASSNLLDPIHIVSLGRMCGDVNAAHISLLVNTLLRDSGQLSLMLSFLTLEQQIVPSFADEPGCE